MKITRLQLVLIFLVMVGIGVGGVSWYRTQIAPTAPKIPVASPRPVPAKVTASTHAVTADASPAPTPISANESMRRKQVAQLIADVGESYRKLSSAGEIPAIAQPLRAAKTALAAGKLDEAKTSAEKAQKACKEFRKTSFAGTYQVAKGDTLWSIAERQTPVRHGAGWVGLWKANKRLVRNFDNIEVGWTLVIPARAAQYATPFWKPRLNRLAAQLVDIRELPVNEEVNVAELPVVRPPSEFEAEAFRRPPADFLPPVHYNPTVVP